MKSFPYEDQLERFRCKISSNRIMHRLDDILTFVLQSLHMTINVNIIELMDADKQRSKNGTQVMEYLAIIYSNRN